MLATCTDDTTTRRLIYSGRTGELLGLQNNLWYQLIQEQESQGAIGYRSGLDDLIRMEALVEKDEDETFTIIKRNLKVIEKNKRLNVVIMPTARCNLICDYCGQEHAHINLTEAQANILIARVRDMLNFSNYTTLHVKWFGGEPLIGIKLIHYITSQLFAVCRQFGVAYSSMIVTNGTLLTTETGRQLFFDCGITKYEITFDGPESTHDTRRKTKTGEGTYQKIINNLISFVNSSEFMGATIIIRCNIDSQNVNFASQLVDDLTSIGLAGRVRLYFATIYSWGEAVGQKRALTRKEFSKKELKLAKYAIQKGFPQAILPEPKAIACIHLEDDGVVISPDGGIYTCTEIPLVPKYHVNSNIEFNNLSENNRQTIWREGHITEPSPLDGQVRKPSTWYQEILENKWPCSRCEFLGVCGGGCPKDWRENRQVCPQFKYNIEDRMKFVYEHNKEQDSYNTLITK
jgi:uncharacterized protein